MSDDIIIFDRAACRAHRRRAAGLPAEARFLYREVQARLIDRLDDINMRFERVLDLGSGDGGLAAALAETGRRPWLVSLDSAEAYAARGPLPVVGEEEALPFADGGFDLIMSTLGLHWTNDLPGALLQIRRILRPDGLLLAGMFGGETLRELRESLLLAELETASGAAPRVSPFADLREAAGLLQRAGFALPVADGEILTVTYPDAIALMRDLRAMGETNAVLQRPRHFTPRTLLLRAAAIYAERFGLPDGRIPATFQLLTLTGWSPADTQQKPLAPGSARTKLAEALGAVEQSAGDKTPRR
ncbi:MAG TPA: methyltransferase domain-containing protein [Aliidongia sp.]|nr:methyltransferase domain-containing protein [Aliidongia sp.]